MSPCFFLCEMGLIIAPNSWVHVRIKGGSASDPCYSKHGRIGATWDPSGNMDLPSQNLHFNKPPGDSSAHQSLGSTAVKHPAHSKCSMNVSCPCYHLNPSCLSRLKNQPISPSPTHNQQGHQRRLSGLGDWLLL